MKTSAAETNPLFKLIRFSLENKLIVFLISGLLIGWGIMVAPFNWDLSSTFRDPVPVDAIPDIGENQQIVFTEWPGRSPQDVEDQVTYPLTASLLGIPGVADIRSFSMFGFSSIYIIFEEDVEFYWSRSRILEKLNSLPPGTLPAGVQPALGPDATALGQVYWYTLEGRDENGNPAGGWDLHELRSIQDWMVRYSLLSAKGVSEAASVGGFVQEVQIDIDPDALRAFGVTLAEIFDTVRQSNIDIGARNMEINRVEYIIRGIGFVDSLTDIENMVIKSRDNTPVYIKNIGRVSRGPAARRGALDKEGVEAVGGVVVVRYGENPLRVIENVKNKIAEISAGLPAKQLADGRTSKVTIVPFYDRTGLIHETLNTLETALSGQILITIIVVLLFILHYRSSLLISGLLPFAVLITFIAMKLLHVDANIVALSGIAIAIGTMVDMGIVITENIIQHMSRAAKGESTLHVVYRATTEVAGSVLTAVATTIISFLPVFTLQAAEGKLFKPLAYTKTFALAASIFVALLVVPPLAQLLFSARIKTGTGRKLLYAALALLGLYVFAVNSVIIGLVIVLYSAYKVVEGRLPKNISNYGDHISQWAVPFVLAIVLARTWLPFGAHRGIFLNVAFVTVIIGMYLLFFKGFQRVYPSILKWALANKGQFLMVPALVVLFGLFSWVGLTRLTEWLPRDIKTWGPVSKIRHTFPGLGSEFMPALDEGSFLYMPTTMPHASIGEVMDVLRKQDMAINALPEIETAVGKLGRVESPLDPAPISMIETVILYKSEYAVDETGRRLRYRFHADSIGFARTFNGGFARTPGGHLYRVRGIYPRDKNGHPIPHRNGRPFRQWRRAAGAEYNHADIAWPGITDADDIWQEIVRVTKIPGTTSAPKLQPIETRLVMLQSGMRAPMGVKVRGPDPATIEKVGLDIERLLKQVPSIDAATVQADRIVGKPYLEIVFDRQALARYGIKLGRVQNMIETAVGGKPLTMTVEGRERYPVRVRYPRELRGGLEDLENIRINAPDGTFLPLKQVARIEYVRGPQVIKSEDTFLTGYVIFDKKPDFAEVDVVQQAGEFLQDRIRSGELVIPAGVSYRFAGNYENQLRAQNRLQIIVPVALFIIFILLYFKFRSVFTSLLVFSGIAVAWAGGFILIWLYGQPWFLNVTLFGENLQNIFNVHTVNLSVAIWVGFLALFGIATDDGVIIAGYLDQIFAEDKPASRRSVREAAFKAGKKRVRPCLMTTATTLLALLPVLSSTGRGSDIMGPMAIPVFGGMLVEVITMFVVPVLYAWRQEKRVTDK